MTIAAVCGLLILVLATLARRSERWALAWLPAALCGPLMLLQINLAAPEPGVTGQIGLLYPVVFGAQYLRPAGAWVVAATTVGADLAINLSMFDAEMALFSTASVGMLVVTATVLTSNAVTQQTVLAARLAEQASVDALTSLATRRELERVADGLLGGPRARDRRRAPGAALLVVDLDHFKELNDTHGHPAGDRALVHVASLVRRCAGSVATVARLGGDELAVLLPGATRDSAERIAQCIVDCIGTLPVTHAGQDIRLSASVGVCHVPAGNAVQLTDLYVGADEALYRAKLGGRGRFAFAT
ncbi:GGDEF domain-containing protein [Actinotalea sp.]|uniref:GGDEF domain-containing protein n=1 Tax=Actinotalea sp. TaxID=1872145 RepID=UPI0035679B51